MPFFGDLLADLHRWLLVRRRLLWVVPSTIKPMLGSRWRHEKSGGVYYVIGETVVKLDNGAKYDGDVGIRYYPEIPVPETPPEGYTRPISLFLSGFTPLDPP